MAKFTFISDDTEFEGDNEYAASKITVEFDTIFLQSTVNQFEMFLKGCGFEFDSLEIINNDIAGFYDKTNGNSEDDGSNIPESHVGEVVTGSGAAVSVTYPWEGTVPNFWNKELPALNTSDLVGLSTYNISALTTSDISRSSLYFDLDRNK